MKNKLMMMIQALAVVSSERWRRKRCVSGEEGEEGYPCDD